MKTPSTRKLANIDNPEEVFDKINDWFRNENEGHTRLVDLRKEYLTTQVVGECAEHKLIAHVDKERSCVDLSVILNIKVPEEKRTAVREFITSENEENTLAPLEFYYGGKKVSAKSCIPLKKTEVTDRQIDVALTKALSSIEACAPPLLSIMFGDKEVATAIAEVKKCRPAVPRKK